MDITIPQVLLDCNPEEVDVSSAAISVMHVNPHTHAARTRRHRARSLYILSEKAAKRGMDFHTKYRRE